MKKRNRFGFLQTTKNITSNAFLFALQVIISLWYTPFLVLRLGTAVFGFIPLATSITNYFSIITYPLGISVGRHVAVALEKNNVTKANEIYNTNFVLTLFLMLLISPFGAAIIFIAPTMFNVPVDLVREVQILLAGVFIGFLLLTYTLNFSVATFVMNRFDLRNLVALGARLAQIIVIVVLFFLEKPSLVYVSFGIVLSAFLSLAGNFYLWRALLPKLKTNFSAFRKESLGMIANTGVWSLVYQIGFVLMLNVDVLIANQILDLNTVGVYGALLMIPKNLRIFSVAIGSVWGPSIIERFSHSDIMGVDQLLRTSTKITGATLALLVGLICGLASPFLNLWLGSEFSSAAWLLVLMVFTLSTNLIDSPYFNTHLSLDNMRIPALVTFGVSVLYIILLIALSRILGIIGIAIAGAISMTLNFSIFMPVYTAVTLEFPWWQYLRSFLFVFIATFIVAGASFLISEFVSATSYVHLVLIGGLVSALYVGVVYFLVLNSHEKKEVRGFLSGENDGYQSTC